MRKTIDEISWIARPWLAAVIITTLGWVVPAMADEAALRVENAALRAEIARLEAQIAAAASGGQCGAETTADQSGSELALVRKLARQSIGHARLSLGFAAGPVVIPDEILSAVVPDEYILLVDGVPLPDAAAAADLIGVPVRQIKHVYTRAFTGFAARLSPEERQRATQTPGVQGVVQNGYVFATATAVPRVNGPAFRSPAMPILVQQSGARPLDVYLFDTGIRAGHRDLEGRVAQTGFTFFDNGIEGEDCSGHGTHVAARIAGRTLGSAGAAQLVSVKVIDRFGTGDVATVIAGIEWVLAQPGEVKLVNMSLTRLEADQTSLLDAAVQRLIDAGAIVVVAAGNSAADAAQYSPARVADAITVGSVREGRLSDFSNAGTGVDIYAPGEEITSASIRDVCGVQEMSGTSMAAPLVTGMIANLLKGGVSPADIPNALQAQAVRVNTGAFAGETQRFVLPETTTGLDALCPTVP